MPGFQHGQVVLSSDEFGYKAEQRFFVRGLHRTAFAPAGNGSQKLTCRFDGFDMRLTDVYRKLIPGSSGESPRQFRLAGMTRGRDGR